jgi:type IV secretory pathway TraG/TraD family ATPase VirD4
MKHSHFAWMGRACLIATVVLVVLAALQMWQIVVFLALFTLYVMRRRGMLAPSSDAYGNARWCNEEEARRAGLFTERGLFLGRFAGPPGNPLLALLRLFTLPLNQSGTAVRQFFKAWTGK